MSADRFCEKCHGRCYFVRRRCKKCQRLLCVNCRAVSCAQDHNVHVIVDRLVAARAAPPLGESP